MSVLQESYQLLNDQQSTRLFNIILASSQIFGASVIFFVALWMGGYEGGFAWSEDPERQYHYHPTFMAMGIVFLAGEAMLVYRIFRHERKRFTKLLHLTLHSMVLIFVVVALKAVWDSHHYNKRDGEPDPIPNLYSIHSWIGLLTVIAYFLQYVQGFTTFFFPGLSIPMRQFFLPLHQAFGLAVLCFVAVTASMGISERAAWHHKCWTVEKTLCAEQIIGNLLGLSILLYAACVLVIVLNPRWRRRPLPEEESLHQLTSTD